MALASGTDILCSGIDLLMDVGRTAIWATQTDRLAVVYLGVKSTVTEARKRGDPLYAALNQNGLLADIRNARERLKAIRPYAVCPYCAGDGCKACLNRGWVGEFVYAQAPNDLKEGGK